MYKYCSDCPFTGKKQTISIEYFDVKMCGNPSNHFKKDVFDCNLLDKCTYGDKCPVFENAPNDPRLIR